MGLLIFYLALGLVAAVGVYVYGRALYRVGYWRGWEAHLELQARIQELRAEAASARADRYAGLRIWSSREGAD
jgi:hypothetical protein